jgi:hypothetical protein
MTSVTSHRTSLLERGPDSIGPIIGHPAQLQAYKAVRELISALRGLRVPADYHHFQGALFGHVLEAERARSQAARNVEREKRGRATPPSTSGNWELELAVADPFHATGLRRAGPCVHGRQVVRSEDSKKTAARGGSSWEEVA